MFDTIGKGHLILHGEARMQNKLVFCNGDGSEDIIPADLLPESQKDGRQMVDAVDVVKHLVQRVRELERQRDYLAFELSTDDDQADCNHTHLPCEHRKGWLCKAGVKGQVQCWISVAEQAAKEAGE